MVFTEYMKVKNNLIVDTKYGKRRVINLISKTGEKGAVWIDQLDAMKHIKANQQVEVVKGAKGSLTILERSVPQETPTQREVGGRGLQHINQPLERTVDDLLEERDLPEFSEADKVKILRYIKSQAKILKHCHETIIESFPEIAITDPKGARSLAITLLISVNQRVGKNI